MADELVIGKDIEKSYIDITSEKINSLKEDGMINPPQNYSVANALRCAWLKIRDTKDIHDNPALSICTKDSIYNALLNTAIMGLNPAKNQIYYIVYGNQLEARRSYFGTMLVVKRIKGVKDLIADVVYDNDVFVTSKQLGNWVIEEHTSSFENIDPDKIKAAYCTIYFDNGSTYTEVMNKQQIIKAWAKSKTQKVQNEFPDQMAKRTVINRACKYIINSSDDSDLLTESYAETSDTYEDEEVITEKKQSDRLDALNMELATSKQEPQAIEQLPEDIIDE
jgi:recombination protein RecT